MRLSPSRVCLFQKTVLRYFDKHKRDFPWRRGVTPYKTLVSEIMLQQTQADRVAKYFPRFIKQFPTIQALAQASITRVLRAWQGLGYNRRALFLHRCAQHIIRQHKGAVPSTISELDALPGVGYATACSIVAFAYNKPTVFIETNIRSVYIHHFFKNKKNISDATLISLVKQTLYSKNPRLWYSALMDYGTILKKREANPSRQSAHYIKQKPFKGSTRQIRGRIVKELLKRKNAKDIVRLLKNVGFGEAAIKKSLSTLKKEGFTGL